MISIRHQIKLLSLCFFTVLAFFALFHPGKVLADTYWPDSNGNGIPDWYENAIPSYCNVHPFGKYTVHAMWFAPYIVNPPPGTITPFRMNGASYLCPNSPYSLVNTITLSVTSADPRFSFISGTQFTYGPLLRGNFSPVGALTGSFDFAGLPYNTCFTYDVGYHIRSVVNGVVDQADATTPFTVCTPPPPYHISGNVFNDVNRDTKKDNGESNYNGPISVYFDGTLLPTGIDGTYTINSVTPGTHTVSYGPPPSGYQFAPGASSAFLVSVGSPCSVSNSSDGICTNGSIDNLNFAITNNIPWYQTYNGDVRIDTGVNAPIPASAQPSCTSYYSVADSSRGGQSPGVVYSGGNNSSFGQGNVSSTQWLAGGTTFPEVFRPGALNTAYNTLLTQAQRGNISIKKLSSVCNEADCTLPNNLPSGIYQSNGNVKMNSYTVLPGRNYIFLINGNLTLAGDIHVQDTSSTANPSTILFSAKNDIHIDKSVGAAPACPVPTEQVEGFYSADRNFIVDGWFDCINHANDEKMLNMNGSIIVNAARNGGSFQMNRDLCQKNLSYPAFTIGTRLDLLLKTSPFLLKHQVISHEEAP